MRNRFFRNTEFCAPLERLRLTVDDDGAGDSDGGGEGGDTPPKDGKGVVTMPQDAFNKRLERAKQSGLNEVMKLLGVEKPEDLKALAEKLKAPEPEPSLDPAKGAKTEADAEIARLKAQAKDAEKRAKAAEERRTADLEAAETERRLEREALRAGISGDNSDYALNLLRKHVSTLDEKAAGKFDARVYFAELAKKKPHLCEPEELPADTGTGGSGAEDEPSPEKGAGKTGAPPQKQPKPGTPAFDAMKSDKAAVAKRLAQLRAGGK